MASCDRVKHPMRKRPIRKRVPRPGRAGRVCSRNSGREQSTASDESAVNYAKFGAGAWEFLWKVILASVRVPPIARTVHLLTSALPPTGCTRYGASLDRL